MGEWIRPSAEERSPQTWVGVTVRPLCRLQMSSAQEAGWAQFKAQERKRPCPLTPLQSSLWLTGPLHEIHVGALDAGRFPDTCSSQTEREGVGLGPLQAQLDFSEAFVL